MICQISQTFYQPNFPTIWHILYTKGKSLYKVIARYILYDTSSCSILGHVQYIKCRRFTWILLKVTCDNFTCTTTIHVYPVLWLMQLKRVLSMKFWQSKFCGWPIDHKNLKNYIPWKFVYIWYSISHSNLYLKIFGLVRQTFKYFTIISFAGVVVDER